jgi:4-amino-4-deoxy-L-arabinose transferase-like glycosyltransferase
MLHRLFGPTTIADALIAPHQYKTRTLVILGVAALVVCSIPAFGMRFLNDMAFYSLFADKLLSGGLLYRDAMDTKPPLVFIHYAAVFKVFGLNNVAAVKVVTMAWLGSAALIMVALRRALSPRAAVPALAAPLFILASFSGWGQDFVSSNTEILANLFIVAGVWFLVARDMSPRPLHLIAGGACIGVACLYRYQSGAALMAYGATILLRHRQFDRKVARVLLVGAGCVLPVAAFVAYYAHVDALDSLRLLLAYQRHYTHDADDFYSPEALGQVLKTVSGLWPLLLPAVWQAVTIFRKRASASRADVFQVAFAVFSAATFFLGGRLFPHYFVQAIPPLVLLAADRLDAPAGDVQPSRKPWQAWFEARAIAIMIATAAVFAAINGTYYWTRKEEPPKRDLVAFVDAHSLPSDQVLLWTWRP